MPPCAGPKVGVLARRRAAGERDYDGTRAVKRVHHRVELAKDTNQIQRDDDRVLVLAELLITGRFDSLRVVIRQPLCRHSVTDVKMGAYEASALRT